jgi:hypothetical protein
MLCDFRLEYRITGDRTVKRMTRMLIPREPECAVQRYRYFRLSVP